MSTMLFADDQVIIADTVDKIEKVVQKINPYSAKAEDMASF